MISLEEYKEALGKKLLKELTEEQILKLRDNDDKIAEIMFKLWLENTKKKRIIQA